MKHFKLSEFSCPCCGDNKMNPSSMERIDKAREIAGVHFVINSAKRCDKHNRDVGGEDDGAHELGFAFDIKCKTSQDRFKILSSLIKAGFTRIGVYPTFIHADDCPILPQKVVWYK